MLVLILVFVLVLVFDLDLGFSFTGGRGRMGKADIAKAALDLDLCFSFAGFSRIVLIEMRAVIVLAFFPLFRDTELAVIVEVTEAAMDIEFSGQGLGDDQADPGIGVEDRQVLDIVAYVELYILGELRRDLYIPVHRSDTGLLIEFKIHFPVGDIADRGFAKFHIDGVDVLQFAGGETPEFAAERNFSVKVGQGDLTETVGKAQAVGRRHMHRIVDIKGPVFVRILTFVPVVMHVANFGLEGNDISVMDVLHADLVHDVLGFFIGGAIGYDLDIHRDLGFVPGEDLNIAEGVLYFQFVVGRDRVALIDRPLLLRFFAAVASQAEQGHAQGKEEEQGIKESYMLFHTLFF